MSDSVLLRLTPNGRLVFTEQTADGGALSPAIAEAFARSPEAGLLYLGAADTGALLPTGSAVRPAGTSSRRV